MKLLDRRVLIGGVFATMSSFAALAQETKVLKIGVSAALTKPFGQTIILGMQAAAAYINGENKLPGFKVDIVPFDDEGTDKGAVSAVNFLASRGVRFVFGPFSSVHAGKVARDYLDHGIIQFTPAQAVNLTGISRTPNFFRINPHNGDIIKGMLEQLLQADKYARFAVLGDTTDFGKDYVEGIKQGLIKAGKLVVLSDSFPFDQKDFSVLRDKMRDTKIKPDVVVFASVSTTQTGDFIRQVREGGSAGGWQGQIILPGIGTLDDAVATAACDLQGVIAVGGWNPVTMGKVDPTRQKYIDATPRPNSGVEFKDTGPVAFAAVEVIADAVRQAQGFDDLNKLLRVLNTGSFGDTIYKALGSIAFRQNGDLVSPRVQPYQWGVQKLRGQCSTKLSPLSLIR